MEGDFHILIIDEDPAQCQALAGVIAAAGYRVACLAASDDPFRAICSISPDLVIFEIPPPGIAALRLLQRIASHRQTRHQALIVISGMEELEYELLDVFDFLPRPLDQQRLLENIALLAAAGSSGQGPYPPLGEKDLLLFQTYLVTHSGLHFDLRNSKILERGLVRRMRAVNASDYTTYHDYLNRYGESRQELKKLLGLLTVGETYFFRYLAHFSALAKSVIPEIMVSRRKERTLRIWSAGCSTGEEPYSLAMLLLEEFPELAGWDLQILATDINQRSLHRARQGIYGPRALRVTEPRYRDRYFHHSGNSFLLDSRVRAMVRFVPLNLQTGIYPSAANGTAGIDILLCRNVMIYFSLATTRRIIERFSHALTPGGYLFLGHAETLLNISENFRRLHEDGGFYYRLLPPRPEAPVVPQPVVPQPVAILPPPKFPPVLFVKPPSSEPSLESLFAEAQGAAESEDFGAAAQKYVIILRRDPTHVGALVGQGFLLANQGAHREALDLCAQALDVDDLSPDAYFLRGLIFDLEGDLPGAVSEYRRALLLDLDFVMAHYNLGKVYWRQGRRRDARRELNNTRRLLENWSEDLLVPYSGGLSRAVFLEVCREDGAVLDGVADDGEPGNDGVR